jgi:hypothetical protein
VPMSLFRKYVFLCILRANIFLPNKFSYILQKVTGSSVALNPYGISGPACVVRFLGEFRIPGGEIYFDAKLGPGDSAS